MLFALACGFASVLAARLIRRIRTIITKRNPDTLLSPFAKGVACRCPRCGEGKLFSGFLDLAPKCESCGLDHSFAESGDGPAFFVIFAVAPIVVILAFIVEALFHPAPWMHLMLWIPTIIILSVALLCPFKGVLIALQYHRAGDQGVSR